MTLLSFRPFHIMAALSQEAACHMGGQSKRAGQRSNGMSAATTRGAPIVRITGDVTLSAS